MPGERGSGWPGGDGLGFAVPELHLGQRVLRTWRVLPRRPETGSPACASSTVRRRSPSRSGASVTTARRPNREMAAQRADDFEAGDGGGLGRGYRGRVDPRLPWRRSEPFPHLRAGRDRRGRAGGPWLADRGRRDLRLKNFASAGLVRGGGVESSAGSTPILVSGRPGRLVDRGEGTGHEHFHRLGPTSAFPGSGPGDDPGVLMSSPGGIEVGITPASVTSSNRPGCPPRIGRTRITFSGGRRSRIPGPGRIPRRISPGLMSSRLGSTPARSGPRPARPRSNQREPGRQNGHGGGVHAQHPIVTARRTIQGDIGLMVMARAIGIATRPGDPATVARSRTTGPSCPASGRSHSGLAQIDHDYRGHRVKAMHEISMAIRRLSHRTGSYRIHPTSGNSTLAGNRQQPPNRIEATGPMGQTVVSGELPISPRPSPIAG